jgi:hypothetical protein
MSRVVWRRSAGVAGREETMSHTDRQHDGDSHGGGCMRGAWRRRGGVGPAASGVGRQCRHEWQWRFGQELARRHCSDGSDPIHYRIDFLIFKLTPNFEIQHEGHPDVQKYSNLSW